MDETVDREGADTGERNDGGIFDFFCCSAGVSFRARADFRSMEQLTAETQGSSGSETSGYPSAYVSHARDGSARARKLWARALEIDDAQGAFVRVVSK